MKLVVSQFVTLDGVIEAPGGGEGFEFGGWSFKFDRGSAGDKFKLDEVMAADALLLGRRTYEGFAAAWPSIKDQQGFAEKLNGMRKYVVSTTLDRGEWENSVVLKGNIAEEIAQLKGQPGGDLLVNGSAQLLQTLIDHDLVDEYRLMVFPTVLGKGKRLFAGTGMVPALRLIESRPVGPDGIVILTYEPIR